MKTTGKVKDIARDWETNKLIISFLMDCGLSDEVQKLASSEKLSINVEKYAKDRSDAANRLMWECIDRIAADRGSTKWEIYLLMLKRYGVFTYVCIKPKAVEMYKK